MVSTSVSSEDRLNQFKELLGDKFQSYKENIRRSGRSRALSCSPVYWITGAFEWASTAEGYDFWSDMNKKWRNLIG